MNFRHATGLAFFVFSTWMGACSSSSTATDAADAGAETDGGATEEETSITRGAGETQTTIHQALTATDSIFNFDPTIDPAATPQQNALAIQSNVQANLDTCGSVTVADTTVTVSFGAAPGCTLKNGVAISGTTKVVVTKSGTTTTLAVTFDAMVVNGHAFGGSMTLGTTDGFTFQTAVSLTSGSNSYTGNLTVVGASGAFTVSGTITSVQGSTSSYTFTALTYTFGDCYPNGGSLAIVRGAAKSTLGFTTTTPTTGTVNVTVGKRTYPSQLPTYGSCPGQGWSVSGRDAGRDAARDAAFEAGK